MAKKPLMYLSGGMHSDWREPVKQALAPWYDFFDPMSIPSFGWLEAELDALKSCDVVLAYMDTANPSGFGLSFEVGAAWALGKPVCWVNECKDHRANMFPMHAGTCFAHFASLNTAIAWFKQIESLLEE